MTAIHPALGPRAWNRIDGIDLLRGLSILFVLMNHVNMRLLFAHVPYTRGLPHQLVVSLVWNGQQGVQMFFVVSGFLITSTSMRRWGSPASLNIRDFYLLRLARIAPLMLLVLLVLTGLHLAHMPNFIVSQKTGGLPRALLAALTFHINFLEATRGYLPANWDILWSLSVEEMFYLFFPLIARGFHRIRFLTPLLLLFVLAGPFARTVHFNHNEVWQEYSYFGGMDAIAFGCLAAMLLSTRRLTRAWMYACGLGGSVLIGFILAFSIKANALGLGKTGLSFTVLGVGTCLVIAASSQSAWKAPRLLAPLLVLGQRSYEIYLTHMFAVMALFTAFLHFGKPLRGVPVLFLSLIFVAGLLGWAVAILYAEPMNRLIRRRAGIDTALGAASPHRD
jgi:peptidoglycan/LPS O-acetylase OafA/YrhL